MAFSEIPVYKYSESNRLEVAGGGDNGQLALNHPDIAISYGANTEIEALCPSVTE